MRLPTQSCDGMVNGNVHAAMMANRGFNASVSTGSDGIRVQDCGCDPGDKCIGPCILGSCAGQCMPTRIPRPRIPW